MFLLLFCFLHTFHLGRHGHSYAHIIISLPMRHWVRWDHIICSCILHGRGRRSRRRSRERSGTAKGELKRRKGRRAFAIFCCFCAVLLLRFFHRCSRKGRKGKERKEERKGRGRSDCGRCPPAHPFSVFCLVVQVAPPFARSAWFGMRIAGCELRAGVAGWGCGSRAHRVRLFYFYGIKTLRLCVSFFFVACLVM
jgi:hypothetical protein